MSGKTLYISDLDGTLLNTGAELSAYSKDVLNSLIAAGHSFSIATARTAATVNNIVAGVAFHIPIVLMNGVAIYDAPEKKYIETIAIPAEACCKVVEVTKRLGMNCACMMYELEGGKLNVYHEKLYNKLIGKFVEDRTARYEKVFTQVESFSGVSPENIAYFTVLDTRESLRHVSGALANLDIGMVLYPDNYTDCWYLEIYNARVSKYSAVMRLREMFGFDKVVCFGDNLNDLPMFEASDVKIAPKNATPEVKATADIVCGSNDEDGVARWLEENVL